MYSGCSASTKAYFGDWDRLKLVDGVLYRIWDSANGINKSYQVIAPCKLQQKLFEQVHDGRIAAHMGRRKTMHALLCCIFATGTR